MNTLMLEGRTTKDFVDRNGVATSSIAVDKYKGSFFIDVACFGKVAEYCLANVKKGSRIVVEGELNIYEKDGRKFVSCSAKNVIYCGRKEFTNEKPQDEIIEQEEDLIDTDDDSMLPF